MPKPREPITDAELQLLRCLWEHGTLTAREIAEAMYRTVDNSTIGTVQKLLQRLERKRCVKRDRREFAHRFSTRVSQSEVAGRHLAEIARKVSDGSLAPFITHLVTAGKLTPEEREQIRRILED
jgi:predicted transcriptional regulator